jgi:hypothetical protein
MNGFQVVFSKYRIRNLWPYKTGGHLGQIAFLGNALQRVKNRLAPEVDKKDLNLIIYPSNDGKQQYMDLWQCSKIQTHCAYIISVYSNEPHKQTGNRSSFVRIVTV